MNKKNFLINCLISIILAIIVQFLILPSQMCSIDKAGAIGCDYTPIVVRIIVTLISFIVLLGLIYLIELIFKKFKK